MKKTTMAARQIVDAAEGGSTRVQSKKRFRPRGGGRRESNRRIQRTHADNVPGHIITKCQITGHGNEEVNEACGSDAGRHHAGGPNGRVVFELVEDGEHLR